MDRRGIFSSMYEKIYKDFSDWLKFTEAKILAVITIQIGFLYFICNIENLSYKKIAVILGIMSCLVLLYSLVPKLNIGSSNVLYYGAWLNKDIDTKNIEINDSDYWMQCDDLARIIQRKMMFLKYSMILISIQVVVILIPFVCKILEAIK